MKRKHWTHEDPLPRARKRLVEAEAALDASIAALRTHGHQSITWELYAHDCKVFRECREDVAMLEAL